MGRRSFSLDWLLNCRCYLYIPFSPSSAAALLCDKPTEDIQVYDHRETQAWAERKLSKFHATSPQTLMRKQVKVVVWVKITNIISVECFSFVHVPWNVCLSPCHLCNVFSNSSTEEGDVCTLLWANYIWYVTNTIAGHCPICKCSKEIWNIQSES